MTQTGKNRFYPFLFMAVGWTPFMSYAAYHNSSWIFPLMFLTMIMSMVYGVFFMCEDDDAVSQWIKEWYKKK